MEYVWYEYIRIYFTGESFDLGMTIATVLKSWPKITKTDEISTNNTWW